MCIRDREIGGQGLNYHREYSRLSQLGVVDKVSIWWLEDKQVFHRFRSLLSIEFEMDSVPDSIYPKLAISEEIRDRCTQRWSFSNRLLLESIDAI